MKTKQDIGNITLPAIVRLIGIAIICSFLCRILSLSTPCIVIYAASALGDFFGRYLSRKRIKLFKVFILHIIAYLGFKVLMYAIEILIIGSNSPVNDFLTYRWAEEIQLLSIFYSVALLFALGYWRFKYWVNYEALFIFSTIVYSLKGHRKYFLDAPKTISSLAWDLGVEPQYLLIAIGLFTAIFVSLYLIISSTRCIFGNQDTVYERLRPSLWLSVIITILCLGGFIIWGFFINNIYSMNMSRSMNGVGQNTKEGESPLGFHSALGQTKQPAALVRLESSYNKNPWFPMLYIRESAISKYNGQELVIASVEFDQDVIIQRSFDSPQIDATIESGLRQEVTQSVYLLSNHNTPFAIDYPITLRYLKNPDQQRFVGAYQVISQAPIKAINDLLVNNVGNASWNRQQWEHYLRAPGNLTSSIERQVLQSGQTLDHALLDSNQEDLRYKILSDKITIGITSPVQKAQTIAAYLSEHSIYTRSPGHDITNKGDPVAPYLFSDEMRGYCVHFAHAAVYLMRLAGIPARIATGYLTDLNYSKDGHILLTMADRHAWPEIYVERMGWVVVDVSPARAENEQAPIPDEKLLEELMSKLDPAELLATQPSTNKEKTSKIDIFKFISMPRLFLIFEVVCALFIFTKLINRYCYLVARNPKQSIRLIYFSILAKLADLSQLRNYGETRQEFCTRAFELKKINLNKITELYEKLCYQKDFDLPSSHEIKHAQKEALVSIAHSYHAGHRLLAFFSINSIIRFYRL